MAYDPDKDPPEEEMPELDAVYWQLGRYQTALRELVAAIGKKWDGETPQRRSNALSPRIEEALARAKAILMTDD